MAGLLDLLFQGITLGGLYAMIGVGLALNFGILRVVNLAQGELITIGAFFAVGIITLVPDLPLVVVLIGAFAGCAAVGALLQGVAIERAMAFRDPMVPMLVTFGLAIVLRNTLVETVGANLRGLDISGLAQARLTIGELSFGVLPLVTLLIAVLVFACLAVLIFRTRFGRQVRALSDNPEIAALMGIHTKRVHAMVAALSAGLAAVAGVLLAMRASVSPFSGVSHLLIAFEVVVLGGLGSIRGALAAGLVLGMTQVVSSRIDGNAGLLYVHLVFFALLVWRAVSGRLA